jgi:hypothetical protein
LVEPELSLSIISTEAKSAQCVRVERLASEILTPLITELTPEAGIDDPLDLLDFQIWNDDVVQDLEFD